VIFSGCGNEVQISELQKEKVEREKIILLPPAVYSRVFITNDSASPEYIKEMADYVIYLATNYTPDTIDSRLKEFLKYVEPSAYQRLKKQIKEISADVKFYGRVQAFYPEKFQIDPQNKQVLVTGRLVKSYMGKTLEDKKQTYVLKYVIRNGEFLVTSLYPANKNQEVKK
jgi:type IV conjugative transfer system protein TraE